MTLCCRIAAYARLTQVGEVPFIHSTRTSSPPVNFGVKLVTAILLAYIKMFSLPSQELESLCKFVSGEISPREFESILYGSSELEQYFSSKKPPSYFHGGISLYHYLIGVNYSDPAQIFNAQDRVQRALEEDGCKVNLDTTQRELHELILSAQPKWLEVPTDFVAELLKDTPDISKAEKTKWLKAKLLSAFQCLKKPPKWLQDAMWPIQEGKPLIFVGQLELGNEFHDDSVVYVFLNSATKKCVTIIQSA
ncbi:MAG: hypothetical protein LBQ20_09635 [Rhodanobacter sp.]|jgi:hypothetical protein|nr:hypothetical protein [Rhodanobacter sp.]